MNGKWWFVKLFFLILVVGVTATAILYGAVSGIQGRYSISGKVNFWDSVQEIFVWAGTTVWHYTKLIWPVWPYVLALVAVLIVGSWLRRRREDRLERKRAENQRPKIF